MNGKLKVALIGCGGMGMTHNLALKALSKEWDIEMTAIADCREEALKKGAALWTGVHTYDTGMELLAQETPDIVHICLPSYLHAEHAIVAMKKGSHVFIEKPVCLTREDGERLLKAEKETGVKVMVGQVLRSFPEYLYLKKVYEEGALGKLKSLVMQRISGKVKWGFENWFHDEVKSGSVVLDLHIHDLDFLRYMLGEPDSFEVKAAAYDSGMINQVVASYQFGKVFAVAEAVWDESPALKFEPSYRACFEKGTLCFNGTRTPSLTFYSTDGEISYPKLKQKNMEDHSAGINISNLGPYYTEIQYFLKCIRQEEPVERAPLAEGVKSVLLGRQVLAAAKQFI